MKALTSTDFHFDGQKSVYHGKVRDVYNINDDIMVMVATDRISAFDVILPKGIPFKGQVLNQIAAKFLDQTTDICPNWKLATPDPMVTVGLKCEGFRVEMIIRSILTGSAWREYQKGCRELCGVKLPEGMKENQRFPEPIITPTTKADEGHDMNISKEEIIAQGLVSKEDYEIMEDYTRKIFARGQEIAAKHGLILVDTKYEFGKRDGKVILIDEIHTPDSSRYFYADGYAERFEAGEPQKQLSKEFVRQWLIDHNFMGNESVTELLKLLEDRKGRFVCIAAGYTREMGRFLDSNSGLKSRFTKTITFEDYNPEELMDIFCLYCRKEGYSIEPEAETILKDRFIDMYDNRAFDFGNGRDVRNMFGKVKSAVAGRAYSKMKELVAEGADRQVAYEGSKPKTITKEDLL